MKRQEESVKLLEDKTCQAENEAQQLEKMKLEAEAGLQKELGAEREQNTVRQEIFVGYKFSWISRVPFHKY